MHILIFATRTLTIRLFTNNLALINATNEPTFAFDANPGGTLHTKCRCYKLFPTWCSFYDEHNINFSTWKLFYMHICPWLQPSNNFVVTSHLLEPKSPRTYILNCLQLPSKHGVTYPMIWRKHLLPPPANLQPQHINPFSMTPLTTSQLPLCHLLLLFHLLSLMPLMMHSLPVSLSIKSYLLAISIACSLPPMLANPLTVTIMIIPLIPMMPQKPSIPLKSKLVKNLPSCQHYYHLWCFQPLSPCPSLLNWLQCQWWCCCTWCPHHWNMWPPPCQHLMHWWSWDCLYSFWCCWWFCYNSTWPHYCCPSPMCSSPLPKYNSL